MTASQILEQLTEGTILEGPHWTEPVKVLTAKARGTRIEVQAVGLHTERLWNKLLTTEDFDGTITVTQVGELAGLNGNPLHLRLAVEAHRIRLAGKTTRSASRPATSWPGRMTSWTACATCAGISSRTTRTDRWFTVSVWMTTLLIVMRLPPRAFGIIAGGWCL